MPSANASMDAYIAERFELEYLGRIYGRQRAIVVGGGSIGVLVAGFAVARLSAELSIFVAGWR